MKQKQGGQSSEKDADHLSWKGLCSAQVLFSHFKPTENDVAEGQVE